MTATNSAAALLVAEHVGSCGQLVASARTAVKEILPVSLPAARPRGVQLALEIIKEVRGIQGHGLIWTGRPEWLSQHLLDELDVESLQRRVKAASLPPPGAHRWAAAGVVGTAMARSPEVRRFVEKMIQCELAGTPRSNFNYYEDDGDSAYPHVDEPEFGINMIVMLEQTRSRGGRSVLRLHPADSGSVDVPLMRGEAVLFHARSTVHERTPLSEDETVRIVSIGFSVPGESNEY